MNRSPASHTLTPDTRAALREAMQKMQEPSRPAPREPSRRRPLRRRSGEPVPIPEAAERTRASRTVKVQEVLTAHQRALEERLEEGLRRIEGLLGGGPPMPDQADVAKGVLAYADERFQAMSVRLQRIEDALRRLAGAVRDGSGGETSRDTSDGLAEAVTELGRQQRAFLKALASAQRTALEDLGRRTGEGVVAVANVLREEIDGLRTSVRSLHRTLSWEGMSTARRELPTPDEGFQTVSPPQPQLEAEEPPARDQEQAPEGSRGRRARLPLWKRRKMESASRAEVEPTAGTDPVGETG